MVCFDRRNAQKCESVQFLFSKKGAERPSADYEIVSLPTETDERCRRKFGRKLNDRVAM
jgi:hypothetical protein